MTQLSEVGWLLLAIGAGSGALDGGGYYYTLVSPDRSQLTLLISTLVRGVLFSLCSL